MSIPSHLDDVLYPLNRGRHSHPNSFYSDEMAAVSITLSHRELASERTANMVARRSAALSVIVQRHYRCGNLSGPPKIASSEIAGYKSRW